MVLILLMMSPIFIHQSVYADQQVDPGTLVHEDGYWSRVYYTKEFLPGYPEYYPLIIGVSSLGSLPKDVARHINYTNTVFINKLDIQSNLTIPQFQDEGGIFRSSPTHDLIGTKPLFFKFAVYNLADNVTNISFHFRLEPYNLSGIVANDLFDINIKIQHEATGHDFLKYFGITMLPLFVLFVEGIIFYPKFKKHYLENIRFWKFFFHIYHVKYVIHVVKYNFRLMKYRES